MGYVTISDKKYRNLSNVQKVAISLNSLLSAQTKMSDLFEKGISITPYHSYKNTTNVLLAIQESQKILNQILDQ